MEAAMKNLEKIDIKETKIKLVSVPKAEKIDNTLSMTEQEELERQLRLYAQAEYFYNSPDYNR
jgi:hypothetical protein